jgi:RNA polymerase sigma-70 factor (ECF subfamily)
MITNKCINYLNSSRAQREKYTGIWLPEPLPDGRTDAAHSKIESYHALSIGFLVLLEKLTPQERAIFLLREVFAYDYFELADIFDKSEDNCRQIFKRAKDNLGKDVKRFEVDMQRHERMLKQFLMVVSGGNMDDLIGILKEDIVLFADGGGTSLQINGQRLTASLKPIYGRENVCRFLLSVTPKVYQHIPELNQRLVVSNGMFSNLSFTGPSPISLITIEPEGDKIGYIYVQSNPAKLKHFYREMQ